MERCPKLIISQLSMHQQFDEKPMSQLNEMQMRKCSSQVFTSEENDENDFGKICDNTTCHGKFSNRTDESSSSCTKRKQDSNQGEEKSQNVKRQKQFPNFEHLSLCSKVEKKTGALEKLKIVSIVLSKLNGKLGSKLLAHLSKTSTADKYIRLIYSFLKLYRALCPQNKLSHLSKELLNARRILQWESKYQLAKQFLTQQLSAFQVGYKTLQLSGSLFDFVSFWIQCLSNGSSRVQKLAQTIYQWQDDCYFYQCVIELTLSTKKLIQFIALLQQQNQQNQTFFNFKHHLTVLRQRKQNLQKKVNLIKTLQGQHSKQTQGSECIILQTLEGQLQSMQKQIQGLIKGFKTCSYQRKTHLKKQALRNGLKVMKYVLDSVTSFNNYSRKSYNLNATLGGVLSILSSIISLMLIWMF